MKRQQENKPHIVLKEVLISDSKDSVVLIVEIDGKTFSLDSRLEIQSSGYIHIEPSDEHSGLAYEMVLSGVVWFAKVTSDVVRNMIKGKPVKLPRVIS